MLFNNHPNLVLELLFKGCMPDDETRYLFVTVNNFVVNSQNVVARYAFRNQTKKRINSVGIIAAIFIIDIIGVIQT
jgi:hypothetical protein